MAERAFIVFFVGLASAGVICGLAVLAFRRVLVPHVLRASLLLNPRATAEEARAAIEAVGIGLAVGGLLSIVVVVVLALAF